MPDVTWQEEAPQHVQLERECRERREVDRVLRNHVSLLVEEVRDDPKEVGHWNHLTAPTRCSESFPDGCDALGGVQ